MLFFNQKFQNKYKPSKWRSRLDAQEKRQNRKDLDLELSVRIKPTGIRVGGA